MRRSQLQSAPCDFSTSVYTTSSVSISGAVILRTDHQSPALFSSAICRLNDIDLLILIFDHKVLFIVIARAKVHHNVLVPVEEHNRHRIIDLIHLVEVLHLVDIAYVDHREVLDPVSDFVEDLVL